MPGSYARRTGEKIYLRQTSIFVATDTKRDQSRSFLRLSVDHTEGCPRQRDNDAVILYLYVEPDAFSHACGSAILTTVVAPELPRFEFFFHLIQSEVLASRRT